MAQFDPSKVVQGGNDDNVISGGAGDDVIHGRGGVDQIQGGDGHDVLLGDDEDDVSADGDDTLDGGAGNDILISGHGIDTLLGGGGDDLIYNGVAVRGSNDAWAGIGAAPYDSAPSAPGDVFTIDGGSGFDRAILDFSMSTGAVTLDLRSTSGSGVSVGGTNAGTVAGVEALSFSGGFGDDSVNGAVGDDTLRGGFGADVIDGYDGNDAISGDWGADNLMGGAGNDNIAGGEDDDRLDGGTGADILFGEGGVDNLIGGQGDDDLYGDEGGDRLEGGIGNDDIDGGEGQDIAVFNVLSGDATWSKSSDGSWTVKAGADGTDVLLRVEVLRFLDKDVVLETAPAFAKIQGDQANNQLLGSTGNDELEGMNGDDVLNGGDGNDILRGGGGFDTVHFSFNLQDGGVVAYGPGLMIGGAGYIDWAQLVERFVFADGVVEMVDANPYVDDLFYYGSNKDVWAAKVDADQHYMTSGWKEGRNPNPWFDTNGYLAAYADARDAAAQGMDPLTHYLTIGWKKGYDPSKNFDTGDYLAFYGDVAGVGVSPLEHFLKYGLAEGRFFFDDGAWG